MKYKSELSENIIIGALINDINLILEMKDLKTEYFTIKVNKMLYVIIKRLFKAGSDSIDISDIVAIIETDKKYERILDEAGGVELIDTLVALGEDKSVDDIKPHIDNIIQSAFKNEMDDTLTSLQVSLAESGNKPINMIYNDFENQMLDVKGKYATSDKLTLVGENIDKIVQNMEEKAKTGLVGFPFSIPMLNEFVQLERKELVVISGGTKSGKSLFATHEIAYACIKNKVPTLILDSELSTDTFITRLIASLTGYKVRYIRTCKYKESPQATEKVEQAIKDIKEAKLIHKYIVGFSEAELLNEIKRVKIQYGISLVVYDYLKADTITNEGQQERLQLAHLTNMLKNQVCGDMNLAGLCLCQTSPTSGTTEQGYRAFGSSGIEMFSSTTIYLIRKTDEEIEDDLGLEKGGNYKLFIQRNRNNMQMTNIKQAININFDLSRVQVTQAQYQSEELLNLLEENREEK